MFTPTRAINSQEHWSVMVVTNCIPSCRRLCNCWTNSTMRYQFNKELIKESTATWQCSCHHFTVSHELVRWLLAQDKYDSTALRGLRKEIEKPSKQAFSWCDFSARIIPSAGRLGEYNAVVPRERALRSCDCQWLGEGQARQNLKDISLQAEKDHSAGASAPAVVFT